MGMWVRWLGVFEWKKDLSVPLDWIYDYLGKVSREADILAFHDSRRQDISTGGWYILQMIEAWRAEQDALHKIRTAHEKYLLELTLVEEQLTK